ncbi:MAG: hypothetical protein ABIO55_16235 [Ginsengibacter sp.]
MQQKDKILILFDGWHLAYSPTINQLYDILSRDYDVTIVAETSKKFVDQKLPGKNVIYYECTKKKPIFIYKIYFAFLSLKNKEARILNANKIKFREYYYRFRLLKKLLQVNQFKRIIAVDIKNLFYCSLLKQRVDFISLEIGIAENLLPLIDTTLVNCVIIQSKERLNYLFKSKVFKVFFIQNAPVYKEVFYSSLKKGLLYGGTAWDPFGFYHCLEYLRIFKDETLTVNGAVPVPDRKKINNSYKDLLIDGRLIINEEYIENDDLVKYFSQFEIGFCFYNFQVKWINHFNYKSAPSGKLFKYLAAGVPVVCNDIIGFKFVTEFKCGVLIDDLSPQKINEAIKEIRNNHDEYAGNAITAAKHFSFDKAVKPYLNFIKNT